MMELHVHNVTLFVKLVHQAQVVILVSLVTIYQRILALNVQILVVHVPMHLLAIIARTDTF